MARKRSFRKNGSLSISKKRRFLPATFYSGFNPLGIFNILKRRDEPGAGHLERSVARSDRIVKASRSYGFFDWDLKAGYTRWEGGLWAFLGYNEAEFGKISQAEHFLDYVVNDDRDVLTEFIYSHLRGEDPNDVLFRIKKKVGGFLWVEARAGGVWKDDGDAAYLSGIVYDVTLLKEAEEALRDVEARHARILESSNDGIWEWSAESNGVHFSQRCWQHLGYQSDDEVVREGEDKVRVWRRRIHRDDLKHFDQALNDHIEHNKPFDIEYRILGKDDLWRWIRARGQMAFDDAGLPYRMSGTNMDISELKSAQERGVRAKELAEEANRAKSEFLSSMSHELRTPLNAILGFSQLFEMDHGMNDTQRQNIDEIKKAGTHLLQLVGDILDLSKIEAGKLSLSLEPVLPFRTLNDCVELVKTQADERNISVNVSFQEARTKMIKADAVRLKQVILNLLNNAVKYNRENGSIDVEQVMAAPDRLRILVRDTGRGIPVHLQNDMFQPFNRLASEGSQIEGTGVGLVITKQLVEQMGGEIGFESKEFIGSTFWVDFPICGSEGYVSSGIQQRSFKSADSLPELLFKQAKNVLYIEDNPSNQRLLEKVLEKFPIFNLSIASEALTGLYLARTQQPDLVVLDINLPGMDGYEAVEVLKNDPVTRSIPVVALSANAMSHDIEKGRLLGFDHYLTKPINLEEFFKVCNNFLKDEELVV